MRSAQLSYAPRVMKEGLVRGRPLSPAAQGGRAAALRTSAV
jgi:hypothetical protein